MDRSPPTPRLSLLGGFDLVFDGEPVVLSVPARSLLALLAIAHRHRPASRTGLAERLWVEAPPAQAASNLRSVLWRLPRPRGRQLVRSEATSLRLAADLEVDVWRGEALAEALCAAADPLSHPGVQDLAILGMDLLPDWDDEWLSVERESYRQKRLHALERYSARLRERGRFVDALLAGLTAVRSEPLRETAHRRVIEVHLAEGNYSEALRQYQGYEQLLADELGLPPSPAIEELVAPLKRRPSRSRHRPPKRATRA
ncbi:SARP family transcriptional regulator [Aeromicrobium sp. Marseille-Q0843]|uniref:SARP family transcriptional regulator n=1 Tax=Aeromicrobium phoceense TaxID=2754045 RepID=A0A838XHJ8_9ACTN|nr:BTAD domain-containing putative transcriptional regulator [Aeromicrobium phoceense]MBA4608431.1 SARP family transcriptional regulator [Aeromicrobium phoceense]